MLDRDPMSAGRDEIDDVNLALQRYLRSTDTVIGWLPQASGEIIADLLLWQRTAGPRGNVMEIGVHHGRLFIILALCCRPTECAVAVDLFEDQHLNVDHSGEGDRGILEANLARFASGRRIECIKANSLELGEAFIGSWQGMRFISVDGGHTSEATCHDLKLAERLLCKGGIVALDDILNPDWTGVISGLVRYLSEGGTLVPCALIPNKLLLTTDPASCKTIDDFLFASYRDGLSSKQHQEFLGSQILHVQRSNKLAGRSSRSWKLTAQVRAVASFVRGALASYKLRHRTR